MLTVVCSWCGADMGEKPAQGAESGISHGICPKCLQAWAAEGRRPEPGKIAASAAVAP